MKHNLSPFQQNPITSIVIILYFLLCQHRNSYKLFIRYNRKNHTTKLLCGCISADTKFLLTVLWIFNFVKELKNEISKNHNRNNNLFTIYQGIKLKVLSFELLQPTPIKYSFTRFVSKRDLNTYCLNMTVINILFYILIVIFICFFDYLYQ